MDTKEDRIRAGYSLLLEAVLDRRHPMRGCGRLKKRRSGPRRGRRASSR